MARLRLLPSWASWRRTEANVGLLTIVFVVSVLSSFMLLIVEAVGTNGREAVPALTSYRTGDSVNSFQLVEWIDDLGLSKKYEARHYWKTSHLHQLAIARGGIQETEDSIGSNDDDGDISIGRRDYSSQSIVPAEGQRRCFREFCLRDNIFHGGHGDVWRARRLRGSGESEEDALVLKRMKAGDHSSIRFCALREIYFGTILRGRPMYPQFITYFVEKGDYWLVFRDEGVSLLGLMYAVDSQSGRNAMLRTSRIWYKMRTTSAGVASLKGIMYQLIANVAELHRHGILHRDIKPSNILLSRDRLPRVIVADFSSAVDLNHTSFDALMYDALGPSVQESTLLYAPPEVLLSLPTQPLNTASSSSSVPLSIPFSLERPFSYDIWSIGVVFLELLLGSADVFSVDQRTAAMIAQKLQRRQAHSFPHPSDVSFAELYRKALLMASLADYCIFQRALLETEKPTDNEEDRKEGDEGEEEKEKVRGKASARERNRQGREEKEVWMHSAHRRHLHSRHSQAVSSLGCDIVTRILPEPREEDRGEEDEDHDTEEAGDGGEQARPSERQGEEEVETDGRTSRAHRKHVRAEHSTEDTAEKEECSQREFAQAILRRDPLGKGFHDPWGLDLLRRLLHFDPLQRVSLTDALKHAYFHGPYVSLVDHSLHATAKERDQYDLVREQQGPDMRSDGDEANDREAEEANTAAEDDREGREGEEEEEVEEVEEGGEFEAGEQEWQLRRKREARWERRNEAGGKFDLDDWSEAHTLAYLDESRLETLIVGSRSLIVWSPVVEIRERVHRYPLSFFADWTCPVQSPDTAPASLPFSQSSPASTEAIVKADRDVEAVQGSEAQLEAPTSFSTNSLLSRPSTEHSVRAGRSQRRERKIQPVEFTFNAMERTRRAALESGIEELSFHCPHCRRSFHGDWHACQRHMLMRKHGPLCRYALHDSQRDDSFFLSQHPFLSSPHHFIRAEYYQQASLSSHNGQLLAQLLPTCLSQHSLLPVDEQVGWCDLQGRRAYVEDAHALLFAQGYVFTGVFDGHFGSLAAHFVATELHAMFVHSVLLSSAQSNDAFHPLSDGKGREVIVPTWFRDINSDLPAALWEKIAEIIPPEEEELFSYRSCHARWERDRQTTSAGEEVEEESDEAVVSATEWDGFLQEKRSPCLSLHGCTTWTSPSGNSDRCSADRVLTPRLLRYHLQQAFNLTNEKLLEQSRQAMDRSRYRNAKESAEDIEDGHRPTDPPPLSSPPFSSSSPSPDAPSIGGSTATVLFLLPDHILAVASVGDSRIVACCALSVRLVPAASTASPNARYQESPHWEFSMQAVQLSVDHTPYNAMERKRVEDLGGRIEGEEVCSLLSCAGRSVAQESHAVLRVNGKLAVTRSLGDLSLANLLSSEPDVLFLRLPRPPAATAASSDPVDGFARASADVCAEYFLWKGYSRPFMGFVPLFIVIGSDGLWDVMTNVQTVEVVCADLLAEAFSGETTPEKETRKGVFQRISMHLAQEALLRGSSDNIGVSVVDIQDH